MKKPKNKIKNLTFTFISHLLLCNDTICYDTESVDINHLIPYLLQCKQFTVIIWLFIPPIDHLNWSLCNDDQCKNVHFLWVVNKKGEHCDSVTCVLRIFFQWREWFSWKVPNSVTFPILVTLHLVLNTEYWFVKLMY